MAVIRKSQKAGSRAPSVISGINWASPLTQGLTDYWTHSKDTFRNIIDGTTASIGSTAYFEATELGMAHRSTTDDVNSLITINRPLITTWPHSVLLITKGGGFAAMTNTAAPDEYFQLYASNAAIWRYQTGVESQNYRVLNNGPNVTTRYKWMLAVAESRSVFKCYGNGKLLETNSGIGNITDFLSVLEETTLGGFTDSTPNYYNGGQFAVAAWDGVALDQEKVSALYNPQTRWDMLQTTPRTIFLGTTPTATTPTVAIRTTKKSGPKAPSVISGINWASPLTQGLVAAYSPDHNAGIVRDYIDGKNASLAADASIVPSREGYALRTTSSTTGHANRSGSFVITGFPYTISMRFFNYIAAQSEIVFFGDNSISNQYNRMYSNGDSAGVNMRAGSNTFPGNNFLSVGSGNDSRFFIGFADVTLVVPGNINQKLYVNGLLVDTQTTYTCAFPTGIDRLTFGAMLDSTPRYTSTALISSCRIWDRVLSDAELLYNAAPQTRWDIYQRTPRTIFLPGATKPTVTTGTAVRRG